jgi:hypothetical protein
MLVYDASLPHHPENRDEVAAESIAILAVGKALSGLHDPEARLRVLRWAIERFNASAALDEALAAAAAAAVPADASLSVEGLHAFFEPAPGRQEANALRLHEANDAPHQSPQEISDAFEEPALRCRAELRVVARNDAAARTAVHELADVYEDLAPHCQAGADEPIGDLFDLLVTESRVEANDQIAAFSDEPLEEAPAEVQAAAREDQPLDTLVADFASAIRSLTLQLQDDNS